MRGDSRQIGGRDEPGSFGEGGCEFCRTGTVAARETSRPNERKALVIAFCDCWLIGEPPRYRRATTEMPGRRLGVSGRQSRRGSGWPQRRPSVSKPWKPWRPAAGDIWPSALSAPERSCGGRRRKAFSSWPAGPGLPRRAKSRQRAFRTRQWRRRDAQLPFARGYARCATAEVSD